MSRGLKEMAGLGAVDVVGVVFGEGSPGAARQQVSIEQRLLWGLH